MDGLISTLILVANVICCLSTLRLIKQVFKDKTSLHNYDFVGAFGTVIALLIINIVWILMGIKAQTEIEKILAYTSFGFGTVTLAYWLFITTFKIYYRKPRVKVTKVGDWFG